MIKSFSNFVLLAIFAQISLAKDLGNIFTGVNYIESASPNEINAGAPFSYYKAKLSFYIDVLKSRAAVRNTFSLTLPGVYEARSQRHNPKQEFSMSSIQIPDFASCFISSSIGKSPSTIISCKIIAGVSNYNVVSGELELFLLFDGGGRRDALALAQKWKVGSNKVTFNSVISGELQLTSQNIRGHSTLMGFSTDHQYFLTYLSSESICADGILNGYFYYGLINPTALKLTDVESFIASSVNAFGQPTAGVDLADSSSVTSPNSSLYTVSFGPIPRGQRFYFDASVYAHIHELSVQYTFTVRCASGKEITDRGSVTFKSGASY